MGSSSANEVSTSGRTTESDSEVEVGSEQFLGFPGQLISYSPGSYAFQEFCKAKAAIGGKSIDESISLEYFDGDEQSYLLEGFLYYLSQLEYRLSLPLTNLVKGIMNAIGVYPVQLNGNMWEFYGVKNYKASGGSYFRASASQRRFFDLNSTGQTWNDNVIWVKGNCLQRDDEEPLDLRFRIVKQIAKEETELKFVLEGIGLSRKNRVDSRSKKVRKAQSTRSMAGANKGKKPTTGKEGQTNLAKTPEIDSSVQPEPLKLSKIAQKYSKKWTLKALPTSGTIGSSEIVKEKRRRVEHLRELGEKVAEGRPAAVDDLKEVEERARLAALHEEEDTSKMMEVRANLDEMVEERDRLGRHLMLKGYSEEEVDAIKADTYVEEGGDEKVEVVGAVDGLDGVSYQMVLDNQGDDTELPEGNNEKALREMSLKIKDLEIGHFREKKISTALLSTQVKLQVKLDSTRSREDDVLECNREFAEELDRMREANENREDQHVNVHFKLVEVTQAISDLNHKVEEKDVEIGAYSERKCELKECQQKLDVVLIRENVLEGEIKEKEKLMKRKEKLLKEIPAREELSAEIERLHAQVVDLRALNLAESAKYIKKLEDNAVHDARVDREMAHKKYMYARLESRLEKVRAKFATMVIPDASRSDLLKSIVAYFVEEVKKLES
ncbi:hypothetical protein GIB67_014794 [Kingdonia uniflora]|uniref:Uncharacterized protein n=1 Tax=Kingdonia uniflora TaxID=39325 RepID=A0A7J7NUU5_9MAGN|nr:hypothetical protein GIB67_014794 [Kingdonia uniflora]